MKNTCIKSVTFQIHRGEHDTYYFDEQSRLILCKDAVRAAIACATGKPMCSISPPKLATVTVLTKPAKNAMRFGLHWGKDEENNPAVGHWGCDYLSGDVVFRQMCRHLIDLGCPETVWLRAEPIND